MFLKWDENLNTDIVWIDKQHKNFFKKMDKFLEASSGGRGGAEAISALKESEDYINTHFDTEERYMMQYDYPATKLHKAKHTKYRSKLKELKVKYNVEGASNNFIREFQLGIIDWYKNHINKFDKEFAAYLKTKGQQ